MTADPPAGSRATEPDRSAEPTADGGPFAEALRSAIQARGLGLERLQERLKDRGRSVSVATLSYWQNGRSVPSRPSSLVIVRDLEQVLEVEPGSLAGLLGPPRRRGWRSGSPSEPQIAAQWPEPRVIDDVVGGVDLRWDHRLSRISQHDQYVVGPHRGAERCWSRLVLRAESGGPDRWVSILHTDDPEAPLADVRPLRRCRLGRMVRRPEQGLVVAELLFDRPLARGETVIVEYEVLNSEPYPTDANYQRKFRMPIREYVLEVSFHEDALPTRCFEDFAVEGAGRRRRQVELDDSNTLHAVELSVGPGHLGFEWEWPAGEGSTATAG